MSGVIGGGISGLSTVYYLLKNSGQKVKLFESSQRLGGWIQSTSLPNGLVFEQGPRTIRPKGEQGKNTLMLIEELGLTTKVKPILSNHPAALNRLVYVNGHLYTLPSSVISLFLSKPPFTKPLVSAIFKDLNAPRKFGTDESIYNFVERRLGKEIADYAISPMICGICAGDAKEISVKFLMKSMFDAEQKHGSIIGGVLRNLFKVQSKSDVLSSKLAQRAINEKWSVWSLEGGLEELPKNLEKNLVEHGADIQLNSPCEEVRFTESGGAILKSKGFEHHFDHIYSTIPASQLARLIRKQHPNLAEDLKEIPSVTVAVVNLSYPGKILSQKAFGFLIPPAENIPILGVIYDSCCFPQGDSTVFTVMMGGKWFGKWFGGNPPPGLLLTTAIEQLKNILKIDIEPSMTKVSILKECIPQYVIGHHERVERIRNYITNHRIPLSLVGASYDGVGVNDVIMSAKRAVEKWK